MASDFSDFQSKINSSVKVGLRPFVEKAKVIKIGLQARLQLCVQNILFLETPIPLALIQTTLLRFFQQIIETLPQQHLYNDIQE
jgi:hypothetical protein